MSFNYLNLVLIGAKYSGKTYFLSKISEKLLSLNNETKSYINKINADIENTGQTTATSSVWHELSFKYNDIEFTIDDYDGNITETMSVDDESNKSHKEKLRYKVNQSEGCIFFIPYEENPERLKKFSEEIDAFILASQFSSTNKSPIPACIVITKWDISNNLGNRDEKEKALEYLKSNNHLEVIYNKINDYFKYSEVLVISSQEKYEIFKPIDICLNKTFEYWYKKALKLKEDNKYEELFIYLAERGCNSKKITYDFTPIYNEAEKEFINIIKSKIDSSNSLNEKISISNTYSKYSTLNVNIKNAIDKLNESINITKSQKQKSKTIKFFLTIFIIVLLIAGFIFYKKISLEKELELCLKTDCKSNLTKLKNLQNNLGIFRHFNSIKKTKNELDNNIYILEKNEFISLLNLCFQEECKSNSTSTLDILNKYLEDINSKYNNDNEFEILKIQLQNKIENINSLNKKHNEEIEKKQIEAKIKSCLQTFCIESNEESKELLNNYIEIIDTNYFNDQSFEIYKQDLILQLNKLKFLNFKSESSKFLGVNKDENIDEIDELLDLDFDNSNIYFNEIKKIRESLSLQKKYLLLKDEISNTESTDIEKLSNISSNEFNDFEDSLKNNILTLMSNKYSEYFEKLILENIPSDIFNNDAYEKWNNNYSNLKNYNKNNHLNFTYNIVSDEKIDKYLGNRKLINGINNIEVIFEGKEDYKINFGITKDNRLKSFNEKEISSNNAKKEDFKVILNDKITLEIGTYSYKIVEGNMPFKRDTLEKNIDIKIEDLWNLYHQDKISKEIKKDKLKIIFRKAELNEN